MTTKTNSSGSGEEDEGIIMGNCCFCHEKTIAKTLLYCGRCGIAAYCSQACQRENWEMHKKYCKAVSTKNQGKFSRTAEVGTELLILIANHQDQKIFFYPNRDEALHDQFLFDVPSFVYAAASKKEGHAILNIVFDDRHQLHGFADAVKAAVRGEIPPSQYPEMPRKHTVDCWPFPKDSFLMEKQDLFGQLLGEKNKGDPNSFSICVSINNPSPGCIMHQAYPFVTPTQVTMGITAPIMRGTTIKAAEFAYRLRKTEPFAPCLEILSQLQQAASKKPGFVWIRNIFHKNRDDMATDDLSGITPVQLLRALKADSKQAKGMLKKGKAQQYSPRRFSALYCSLEKDNEEEDRSLPKITFCMPGSDVPIQKNGVSVTDPNYHWISNVVQKHHSQQVADPKTVLFVFLLRPVEELQDKDVICYHFPVATDPMTIKK